MAYSPSIESAPKERDTIARGAAPGMQSWRAEPCKGEINQVASNEGNLATTGLRRIGDPFQTLCPWVRSDAKLLARLRNIR